MLLVPVLSASPLSSCMCLYFVFAVFLVLLLYLLPLVSRSVARKVQKGSSAARGNPTGHFFDYYPSASLPITASLPIFRLDAWSNPVSNVFPPFLKNNPIKGKRKNIAASITNLKSATTKASRRNALRGSLELLQVWKRSHLAGCPMAWRVSIWADCTRLRSKIGLFSSLPLPNPGSAQVYQPQSCYLKVSVWGLIEIFTRSDWALGSERE